MRVLKAYTLYRPDEGYCQAQAPIAAVLLMHMPAEVSLTLHILDPTHMWVYQSRSTAFAKLFVIKISNIFMFVRN